MTVITLRRIPATLASSLLTPSPYHSTLCRRDGVSQIFIFSQPTTGELEPKKEFITRASVTTREESIYVKSLSLLNCVSIIRRHLALWK